MNPEAGQGLVQPGVKYDMENAVTQRPAEVTSALAELEKAINEAQNLASMLEERLGLILASMLEERLGLILAPREDPNAEVDRDAPYPTSGVQLADGIRGLAERVHAVNRWLSNIHGRVEL